VGEAELQGWANCLPRGRGSYYPWCPAVATPRRSYRFIGAKREELARERGPRDVTHGAWGATVCGGLGEGLGWGLGLGSGAWVQGRFRARGR